MIRWRLDPELHGSGGFTTISRVLAVVGLVLAVTVGVHLGAQSWYAGRVMPGVVAGDQQLGGLTLDAARGALQRQARSYRLRLTVAGQPYVLTAAQLGATMDTEATLEAAYNEGRTSWYPSGHVAALPLDYSLDAAKLQQFVASVAERVGVQPVDASVSVSGTKLTPVPDKNGWTVDKRSLAKIITADVSFPGGADLKVEPHTELADIRTAAVAPTIAQARVLMATPIVLSYNGQVFTPSQSDIGGWLTFDKTVTGGEPQLVPQVDVGKLKSYVQKLANQLDIDPVNQLENNENGVVKVTQTGANGTAIDQDPLVAAMSAAVTKQQPLQFTITSHTVVFRTLTTNFQTLAYPQYIEVNLSKQHLWVWQDGNIIYDTPITSGATGAGFPTVTGLFSIYYKTTNTHLVGAQYGPAYNYDVAVKYWMPFYSGFGLHDASWRNGNFGGQDYFYGGSHGCVNLPDAAAAFIYNWSSVGTPVWVHK